MKIIAILFFILVTMLYICEAREGGGFGGGRGGFFGAGFGRGGFGRNPGFGYGRYGGPRYGFGHGRYGGPRYGFGHGRYGGPRYGFGGFGGILWLRGRDGIILG